MMERLEQGFDAVEKISHGGIHPEEMRNHLRSHLREAHALEIQSSNLTKKARENAKDPLFSEVCHQHFEASRKHAKILEEQLKAAGYELLARTAKRAPRY